MWLSIIFIIVLSCGLLDACLPTQNVVTTTTTTTTTTATPLSSSPCTVCPPVYVSGCLTGGLLPELCPTALTAGVTYSLSSLTVAIDAFFGVSNFCQVTFACPIGTTIKVKLPIVNTVVPGPPVVLAFCPESGADAGTWYYGIPPSPVEIVGTTCEPPISG